MQKSQRILSIDTFRGITIFVMVFVNELAGMRSIPQWMKHMPADADAMTFTDMVFPAFLFIVGMSVPLALQNRRQKAAGFLQIQAHIAWRSLGLIVLGFFLVNAEEGYNAAATGLPMHAWLLIFYAAAILTWNVYHFNNKTTAYLPRAIGLIALLLLAIVYRGGENGHQTMQPHWWGILGLIGWAYLYACLLYQLCRGKLLPVFCSIVVCIAFYMASKHPQLQNSEYFGWMGKQAGNAIHCSIVLCGIALTRIFFSEQGKATAPALLFVRAGIFAVVLFLAAFVLQPIYKISKIYATPSWALYSAAACCIIFSLLYWIIDIKTKNSWARFFQPAATNPLIAYLLPGILFSFFSLCHITVFPAQFRFGLPGICWSLFFSAAVLLLTRACSRANIRLQL